MLSPSAFVCVRTCVLLSVLYLLRSGRWTDFIFFNPDLSIHFASSSQHVDYLVFFFNFGVFTFKLDGMLTVLDV